MIKTIFKNLYNVILYMTSILFIASTAFIVLEKLKIEQLVWNNNVVLCIYFCVNIAVSVFIVNQVYCYLRIHLHLKL